MGMRRKMRTADGYNPPFSRRRRGRFVAPRAVDSAAMALGKKFWGTVVFILITEMCERLAYYGLTGSLQIFFQSKLGMAGVRARALAGTAACHAQMTPDPARAATHRRPSPSPAIPHSPGRVTCPVSHIAEFVFRDGRSFLVALLPDSLHGRVCE